MEKKSDRILTTLKEIRQEYAHMGESRNYDELLAKIREMIQKQHEEIEKRRSYQELQQKLSESRQEEEQLIYLATHDALTGLPMGLFVSKKRVEKELKNFEKNFDKYIEQIGKKFPTIKRVLIDERNLYMVQQLAAANEQHEKVIAVVGDGHIPGITRLLEDKELDFETIRLSELRNQTSVSSDSSTASFSLEYKEL